MAIQIQLRRDTLANWAANDPILAEGEIGLELDTNKFKIGNGSDAWSTLPYFLVSASNVSSGAGVPGSTPTKVGDIYIDTTNDDSYIAVGTASSADWKETGGGGYTNLTEFVSQTAWRLFYSNTDGDVVELALGANGTFLKSNGAAAAPTFEAPAGAGDFLANGSIPMTGDINMDGNNIDNGGVMFLLEQAAADADVAGSGQVWVKTATPNELWFTNDAGTDIQLGTFTPTLKTKLDGIEESADVTDTANVTAAGALMDSELADISAIKTLQAPDNTTISTFAASFLDDADEATFKATVNLEIGVDVQAYSSVLANTTASFTTADETKLDYITVTQAVDLDQMEADIAALANGMVYKGDWDASAGTFPGGGTAQTGWFYYVSVGGTVDGVVFTAGDNIVATTDNASGTTYAANWSKHDQTDAVTAVVGLVGSITKSGLLAALNVEDGADVTDTTNVTAAGALMDSEVASLSGIKTLVVPDSTTISDYAKSFLDETSEANFKAAVNLEIGVDVQAYSAVLAATTASFTTADETKLDGIETAADVTDTANVTAAGALMDSELTDIVFIKALSDADASAVNAGSSTTGVVTPDALAGSYAGTKSVSIEVVAGSTALSTGDGKAYITIPEALNGMNLVRATATVVTAGTTNATTIMVHNKTDAADMLSGAISIASGGTVATAGTVNGATDDVATNDILRIDIDSISTTPPQGLTVVLEFRLP